MTCILRHHNECGCAGQCEAEPKPIDRFVEIKNENRAPIFRALEITLSAIIISALGFAVAVQF